MTRKEKLEDIITKSLYELIKINLDDFFSQKSTSKNINKIYELVTEPLYQHTGTIILTAHHHNWLKEKNKHLYDKR